MYLPGVREMLMSQQSVYSLTERTDVLFNLRSMTMCVGERHSGLVVMKVTLWCVHPCSVYVYVGRYYFGPVVFAPEAPLPTSCFSYAPYHWRYAWRALHAVTYVTPERCQTT